MKKVLDLFEYIKNDEIMKEEVMKERDSAHQISIKV